MSSDEEMLTTDNSSSRRSRGRSSGRPMRYYWPYIAAAIVVAAIFGIVVYVVVVKEPVSPPGGGSHQGVKDSLIIGAGVAGLITGYHMSPLLGDKLSITDNRNHLGGKVLSRYLTNQSTEALPAFTPTHAEQFRGFDVIMRCLAQKFNAVIFKRIGPGSYVESRNRGINATGYYCYGNNTPTDSAVCDWGNSYEIIAPNGPLPAAAWNGLPNPCGDMAWTECSYEAAYWDHILDPVNTATITAGESLKAYICRLYGSCRVADYVKEVGISAYLFGDDFSARYAVDYLAYDSAFPYGAIPMPHGGPQVAVLSKIGKYIEDHGANITLQLSVVAINYGPELDGKKTFVVTYSDGSVQSYRRVVAAMPLPQLALLQGEIPEKLRQTKFIQSAGTTHACTLNLAFDVNWWQPRASQCIAGRCASSQNFTLTPEQRAFVTFSFWNNDPTDPNAIPFVQYVPSPERQQGHLLRLFFEDDKCAELLSFETALDIKNEGMRRLRATFTTDGEIPEPTDYFWSDEPYAYTYLRTGANYNASELRAWAAEPFPGELFAIVSENTEVLDSGWEEAAAKSSHSALRGPVFTDLFADPTPINEAERCQAEISGDYLDMADPASGAKLCLDMKNEYNGRDLAGIVKCGSPSVYAYPTRQELIDGTYAADRSQWFGITSAPESTDNDDLVYLRSRSRIVG